MSKQEKAMEILNNSIDLKTEYIREYLKELVRRDTPKLVTDIHCDEYFCPACGAENNCNGEYEVGHIFCPECGQRIVQKKEEF